MIGISMKRKQRPLILRNAKFLCMRRVMPIAERETLRAPTRPLIVNFSVEHKRNFKNARSDLDAADVPSYRIVLLYTNSIKLPTIFFGVKQRVEDISVILRRFADIRKSQRATLALYDTLCLISFYVVSLFGVREIGNIIERYRKIPDFQIKW